MKKFHTRILAWVLTIALTVAFMPAFAMAEGGSDYEDLIGDVLDALEAGDLDWLIDALWEVQWAVEDSRGFGPPNYCVYPDNAEHYAAELALEYLQDEFEEFLEGSPASGVLFEVLEVILEIVAEVNREKGYGYSVADIIQKAIDMAASSSLGNEGDVNSFLGDAHSQGWTITWYDTYFSDSGGDDSFWLNLELRNDDCDIFGMSLLWERLEADFLLCFMYAGGPTKPDLIWGVLEDAILANTGGMDGWFYDFDWGGHNIDEVFEKIKEYIDGLSISDFDEASLTVIYNLLSNAIENDGWYIDSYYYDHVLDPGYISIDIYLNDGNYGVNLQFQWGGSGYVFNYMCTYGYDPDWNFSALQDAIIANGGYWDYYWYGGGGDGDLGGIFDDFDDYIYDLLDYDDFDWDTARYVKDLMWDAVDSGWYIDPDSGYEYVNSIIYLWFHLDRGNDYLYFEFEWSDVDDGMYSLTYIYADCDTNPGLLWGRLIAAVNKNNGECNFGFPGGVSHDRNEVFNGFEKFIAELEDGTIDKFDWVTAAAVFYLMSVAVGEGWQIGVYEYDYYNGYDGYVIYLCFDLYDATSGDLLYFGFEWHDVDGVHSLTTINAYGDRNPGLDWNALKAAVGTNGGDYYIEFDSGGGDRFGDLSAGINHYIEKLIDDGVIDDYFDWASLDALLNLIGGAIEYDGWWFLDDDYYYNTSGKSLYFYVELYDGSDFVYINTVWIDLNDDGGLVLAYMEVDGYDPSFDWDALKTYIIANGGSYDIFGEEYPDAAAYLLEDLEDFGFDCDYDEPTKTIIVTGTLAGASSLDITIPEGVTVVWKADYSGLPSGALLRVFGYGTLFIPLEGRIENTGSSGSALSIRESIALVVDGGTIKGTNGSITLMNSGTVLYLKDGSNVDGMTIDRSGGTAYYLGDQEAKFLTTGDTWSFTPGTNLFRLDELNLGGYKYDDDTPHEGTVTLTLPSGLEFDDDDLYISNIDEDDYTRVGNTIVVSGTYKTNINVHVDGTLAGGRIKLETIWLHFSINIDTPRIFVGGNEVTNPSVSRIQTAITNALNAAPGGGTVEVTGKFIEANSTLTITVPATKTLLWNARYTGNPPSGIGAVSLVSVLGEGVMEIGEDGYISSGANGAVTQVISVSGTLIVNGGRVESTATMGISVHGTVTVNSGVITCGGTNAAIYLNSGGSLALNGGSLVRNYDGTTSPGWVSAAGNNVIYISCSPSFNNVQTTSSDSTGYYIGNYAGKFTGDFALFKLDAPVVAPVGGNTVATFPAEGLSVTSAKVLDGGDEVEGFDFDYDDNIVTIKGNYNTKFEDVTLEVTGTLGGKITVTFTTETAFDVENEGILVNNALVPNPSVENIQSAIETALAPDGATVTVTGRFTGADSRLTLAIESGKKVIWNAHYSGTMAASTEELTYISGAGEMEIAENGYIEATRGMAVAIGNTIALTINGGTVTIPNNSESRAIVAYTDSTVVVNGGNVSSITAQTRSVLTINNGTIDIVRAGTSSTIYVTGGTIGDANIFLQGGIDAQTAYYIGNNGAKFNTDGTNTAFTPGTTLFRLDTFTQSTVGGNTVATFPAGLTVTGATTDAAGFTLDCEDNTVTIKGNYNTEVKDVTLAVTGTLAGGKITVTFTTAAFDVDNVGILVGGKLVQNPTVSSIASEILAALNKAAVGDSVIVTGKFEDASANLALTIPIDKTLVWSAEYVGQSLSVAGAGVLRIPSDGKIKVGTSETLGISEVVALVVDGGTVDGRIHITDYSVVFVADGSGIKNAEITRSLQTLGCYMGDYAAKFGTGFTAGTNLFRLDGYEPSVSAFGNNTQVALPSGLTVTSAKVLDDSGDDVAEFTCTPNVYSEVTISGNYNTAYTDVTLEVTAMIGGKIPVTFTTAAFSFENKGIFVDGTLAPNPASTPIKDTIEAALNAAPAGGTVVVTGKLEGATATLALTIPDGKTLVWDAEYTGNVNGSLISADGQGSMVIGSDAAIKNTSTYGGSRAIYTASAHLTVNGGTLEGVYAIYLEGSASLAVLGGEFTGVIRAYATSIVYVKDGSGITAGNIEGGITAAGYYVGEENAAKFATSGDATFNSGANLFRLDGSPDFGSYTYSATPYAGTVTATLPAGLAVDTITVSGLAANQYTIDGNTVSFAGTYHVQDVTMTVTGTLAGGKIPVSFTTAAFSINVSCAHEYANYTSNNDATCTVDGTETGACTFCNAPNTKTEEDSALGHEYENYLSNGDATCTVDGTETSDCVRDCGSTDTRTAVGSALGHSFEPWRVTTEATCYADGE